MLSHPAALLATWLAAAGPAPTALDQVLALLGEKKCDEAFELVSKVEVPSPPAVKNLAAAQAVARGAEACRTADPLVALSFSGLAKRLAPGEADIVTTHAEGLVAVQQRGEAASELDALIAVQPAPRAPKAWLLRAKIARDEGDLADAVRLLTPLAADPATKGEAEPLLATAKAALQEAAATARPSPAKPPRTEVSEASPGSGAARRLHAPGQVVKVLGGQVGLGGEKSFDVTLEKGQPYVFKATGRCERPARQAVINDQNGNPLRISLKPVDGHSSIFGLDFRVQFGAQGSRSLSVGVGEESENRVPFVADADEMTIRVFDESRPEKEVSCTVSRFSVVAE